jgi:TRAP-type transport system periplasmic protein
MMAAIRDRHTALNGLALAAAIAALSPLRPAAAADYVMKFGTATQNEAQHQYMKFYKEALEKASGGRIEVQIFPNSTLGPIPREIEGVQLGSIQAFMGPVDFFVGVDQRYGVFSTPMLFRDEVHAAATIHDPTLERTMLDLGATKRLVGMATLSVGAANYAGIHPLMRLADFQGKKLRINGTALERAKMSALGATGIAMPLSDVMPALNQGAIDGTISGLSVFVAFKMIDLVKVVTVTNDTMLVSIAVASKPWLDSLPPELSKLVIDTGFSVQPQAQQWEQEFSQQLAKDWTAMGGDVHLLPPEDLATMKTELAGVGDAVTKDDPAVHDMLANVRTIAAKY